MLKKKTIILSLLFISCIIIYYFYQQSGPLSNITIVLDPGHGGKDEGAKGINGSLEKNLNLRTAKELKIKLEKLGATVYLTRNNDTFISLSNRIFFTLKKDADLFISIHYNSSPSSKPEGTTTYYYHEQKDKDFATTIHNHLLRKIQTFNRDVLYGDYHVLRENLIPSTLLELGFISNKREEQYILSKKYQQDITTAITEGIIEYVQNNDYLLSTIKVTGPSLIKATSIIAPN